MSEETGKAVVKGLKGIMAADSSICHIDGTAGTLMYRGYNIDDLATKSTYEETAFLLLYGELPRQKDLDTFHQTLTKHATASQEIIEFLQSLPKSIHPMSALRSAISVAGNYDVDETPACTLCALEKLIATNTNAMAKAALIR